MYESIEINYKSPSISPGGEYAPPLYPLEEVIGLVTIWGKRL
jgi:hypothetical protein